MRRKKGGVAQGFIARTAGYRLNFLSDGAHHPRAEENCGCSPSLDGNNPLPAFPALVRVGNWDDVLDLSQRLR